MSETFVGSRLRLARELQGKTATELAKQMECTPSYITRIEHGEKAPSAVLVDALAEALDVRREFFALQERHGIAEDACHFRSLKSTSAALRARARARGSLLVELLEQVEEHVEGLPSYSVPRIEADTLEGAETAGERTRAALGLGSGPIDDVVGELEHAGVFVTRLSATTRAINAFSWRSPTRGFVVLGTDCSGTRSRFDAGHELGHLVMHEGRSTDATVQDFREKQAHAFSRSFLLPRASFVREFPRGDSLDFQALLRMKARWGVSVAALLYRGRDLGLVGAITYQRACRLMSKWGWTRGEPQDRPLEEPSLVAQVADLLEPGTIDALGWTPATFALVTGLEARISPSAPQPIGGNVVSIARGRISRAG